MSRPGNLVNQIMTAKLRLHEDSDRFNQWYEKSTRIYHAYHHIKDEIESEKMYRLELLRYIPIGTVAGIQGYFSLAIRDIIDHGLPYRKNILKLDLDSKFKMEPILGIFDEKITLGEFVSALLPIRNLEVINVYMSSLLDIKFLDELRNQKVTIPGVESEFSIVSQADEVYADIPKIFEYRHIYCHELAPKIRPKLVETKRLFNSATILILATENLVSKVLSK